jgi:hypothetical protein
MIVAIKVKTIRRWLTKGRTLLTTWSLKAAYRDEIRRMKGFDVGSMSSSIVGVRNPSALDFFRVSGKKGRVKMLADTNRRLKSAAPYGPTVPSNVLARAGEYNSQIRGTIDR